MWPSKLWSKVNLTAITLVCALAAPSFSDRSMAQAASVQCSLEHLLVQVSDDRILSFKVELADTAALRERGLMFRENLPTGEGMLFVYPSPRPVSFWMRNTLIPLDMVFIDSVGVIRHIHPNAKPLDEAPIPGAAPWDSDPNRLLVLEIAGGETARFGMKVGQFVAHPTLNQEIAALRCD